MPDRLDVQFTSGDALCAAWLLLPNSDTPAPVIVMAHGLGAVREMRLDAYAERFQAAGYACLVSTTDISEPAGVNLANW